jgi:hypothetical protein
MGVLILPSKLTKTIRLPCVSQFEKFGESIGDAAKVHDKNIKLAVAAIAEAVTAHSESVNATWPFFQMPSFVSYAHNAMKLSGAEMVWLFNTVPHDLREEYVHWMNGLYYNRVADTNMYTYGDLSRMPHVSSYVPDITWKTDDGFVPDIERDFYYATSDVVPPPYSFLYVKERCVYIL